VTRLLLVTVVAALLAAPAADTGARKLRVGYITSAGAATDAGIIRTGGITVPRVPG
jgi:hypothetical protein